MKAASLVLLAAALSDPAQASPPPQVVVQAMFDAFNRHDAAAMASLYADDARLASSDFCANRTGPADVLRTYRALFAAYPDIRDEIEQVVAQGDHVAVLFVARSGQGSSALAMPIATFLTVRHGRIQSDESRFDTDGRACTP
jgi:hypothetical protein